MKVVCPHELAEVCIKCGEKIFPQGKEDAIKAGLLLFSTATTESDGFKANRQYGFSDASIRGGWSVFQLEKATILDSLDKIEKDVQLQIRIEMFTERTNFWWQGLSNLEIMQQLRDDPKLASVFCRLHYRRAPVSLPDDINGCAAQWKQYYNTIKGKGTVPHFLSMWSIHGKSVWHQVV